MEDSERLVNNESSDSTVETDRKGCGYYFCDPRSSSHRFIALLFMCFLGFGSFFCYDNPSGLQDSFKSDMDLSTAQFSQLYSWYSWPNVFFCFVGGFLIDSVFGIRLGAVIFCGILVIGQIIFALGGIFNHFWLMLVGRFVFGIGGESLSVAQNTYAVSWFKGKELNMVFGLQMSFARVGSSVNLNTIVPLYNYVENFYHGHTCLGVVLLIAALTCVFSFLCSIVLAVFDYRAEKILNKRPEGHIVETIRFSDIKDFPLSFWLMTGTCISYYVAIFPFIALSKIFFERKYDFSPESANSVNSILYLISAIASPLSGLLVDRAGRNVFWVFLSILTTIIAHSLLAFTFLNPYIGMVLLGLSYSMLASALWPMVALVVPEHQLGTAYGIMQAIQNLGLAVISSVAGYIVDEGGYLLLEVFFIAWLCLSLAFAIILWVSNSLRNGTLNMSVAERDRWEHSKIYHLLTNQAEEDLCIDQNDEDLEFSSDGEMS